jgi:hypothetical protein
VTGEWLRVSDLASVQRRLNRFGREQVEYLHAKFANDFDDLPVPPVWMPRAAWFFIACDRAASSANSMIAWYLGSFVRDPSDAFLSRR